MARLRLTISGYVAIVTIVGLGAAAVLFRVADWSELSDSPELAVFLFVLVVAGELFPVAVTFRNERQEITTSTTFVFAMLLIFGPGPAVAAQLIASVLADARNRKPWWKATFNLGQYALSWIATGAVLYFVDGPYRYVGATSFTTPRLLAFVLGATTFFLCNMTLIAVAVALAQQLPVGPYIRRGFAFYGLSSLILFSLVPIVVVVARERAVLVPLLLAPILAVYRTAKIAAENEHQAQYDHLTDLPNRILLFERVRQAIAERPDTPFAIFLFDLDHFKEVNDTLGHQVGDQLLTSIGERLVASVGPTDTVARLGGDEFAVVTAIDGSTEQERTASALAASEVVTDAFGRLFQIDDLTFEIEASIGIALFPDHAGDVEELLRRADVAMYQAKDLGSGIEVYQRARDPHDSKRLALLGELRAAIDSQQIIAHYQPKADLQSGRIMGVEALVRWQHPTLGYLRPDQFIPLAEPTGLIAPLTFRVLDAALSQQRTWSEQGRPLTVSVNVSVRTLYDDHFPQDVGRHLSTHHVSPSMLVLEITESTMMRDPGRAAAVLGRLSHLGVQISVDDFGTGYSSLAYLERLPISEVKIDKSFVYGMEDNREQLAIVSSIVDLGRNLGLRVVAEGVETQAAWSLLRELGCHRAQGYVLARPLAADAVMPFIEQYERELGPPAATPRPPPAASPSEIARLESTMRTVGRHDPP